MIYVVDDDDDIRFVMTEIFEELKLDSISFQDGAEMLASLLQGAQPSLIVADLRMKLIDGLEMVSKIRHKLGMQFPVIVLTGFASPEVVQEFKELGVSHIMVKPVTREAVVKTIKDILDIAA